jgi:DNA-binding NtrC family response regulator
MTIALFAMDSATLRSVVTSLAGEGLDVRAIEWDSVRSLKSLAPEIGKGVLIVPTHGAGEPTELVRRLLTGGRRLILCAPKPEKEDYQLLRELGATEIISPHTRASQHIYERVLGQLILDGDVEQTACGDMYGATSVMRDLYREMTAYASGDDPVLIYGESGTGKELVAREIHRLSRPATKFEPLNCATLSRDLAANQLFGHTRGAYTSATEAQDGLLAAAGVGTVFLDEIGDLEFPAQALLLRVLEDKKVRRLGANRADDMRARFVLATNKDLEVECAKGRFRHDLFERIRGLTLELRPLRERRADIPLLARHFLNEFNQGEERNARLPDGAFDCLFNYEWVGNVRELRSAIRRAALLADSSGLINIEHLIQATRRADKRKPNSKYNVGFDPAVDSWRDLLERAGAAYFQALFLATDGDTIEAAKLSGLSRSRVYDKFNKLKSDQSG